MSDSLAVQVERFVDEAFPGFVECSLLDAEGATHLFVEKVPVVTAENLNKDDDYPRPGYFACAVEQELRDSSGLVLLQVNTMHPWGIESLDGKSSFLVHASQVRSDRAV
jgi:hypothetical protein